VKYAKHLSNHIRVLLASKWGKSILGIHEHLPSDLFDSKCAASETETHGWGRMVFTEAGWGSQFVGGGGGGGDGVNLMLTEEVNIEAGAAPMIPSPTTKTYSSWTALVVVIAKSTFSWTCPRSATLESTFLSIATNWDVNLDGTLWMLFSGSDIFSMR
jgi:hypothetical protein